MVYPCRCPTAEWGLRDKRDNLPRQRSTRETGKQSEREKKEKTEEYSCRVTVLACMAFDSLLREQDTSEDGHCMLSLQPGKTKPLSVRLFSIPSISPPPVVDLRHVHDFVPSDPTQTLTYFDILTRREKRGGGGWGGG